MANNNVIDLASEAAGLPASTAPKLVEKDEYKELRLALLQLVERERVGERGGRVMLLRQK